MSTTALLLLLVLVGLLTYLYRYKMVGSSPAAAAALACLVPSHRTGKRRRADRECPSWPAAKSFRFDTPRPWAALVAVLVAWRTRNVLATIGAGMAAPTCSSCSSRHDRPHPDRRRPRTLRGGGRVSLRSPVTHGVQPARLRLGTFRYLERYGV